MKPHKDGIYKNSNNEPEVQRGGHSRQKLYVYVIHNKKIPEPSAPEKPNVLP